MNRWFEKRPGAYNRGRMTTRLRLLASGALVALLLLAATASWAGPSEPKTQLIVWGLGLGPDSKGLEDVIREFERRNPDINVRVLTMGAGGMNPQKLMTAIVGRVPPDVIHQDRFTIADWASRGAFTPLDSLIARDRGVDPLTPVPEQYYPMIWQEATYEGKLYGIPTGADNRALYWNRKAFRRKAKELRAAGLDPNRPPRTWSEALAYSKVLTEFDERGNLKKAGFMPNFGNSWLYMYAFQNEAKFISDDGRRCTLNSPEAQEALQFMVDGYDILGGFDNANKFESGFQGGENDPFISGILTMKVDGDWGIYGLARYGPTLDFGVAPPPVPDDRYYRRGRFKNVKDQFVTWSGGFCYAIPTGAKHAEAGWKFIKFATSLEGRLVDMRGQKTLEQRRGRLFIPAIKGQIAATEAGLSPEFLPPGKYADALREHSRLAAVTRIRPATFAGQVLWDEHVRAFDLACRKTLTPAEALQSAQDRVQQFLDEHFNREKYPVINLMLPSLIGLAGCVLGLVLVYAGYIKQRLGPLARQEARWGFFFVFPWLAGFLVFTLGPMVASLFFAFTQYNVLTEARWVGGKNFVDLFTHDADRMSKAFYNVIYLGGIGVPLGLVTGLAVAMLLNTGVRGMRYYRTIYYMPAIVPGIASTVLWMWILNADPGRGLINAVWDGTLGTWFGAPAPGWLGVEAWAKPSLLLMGLWGAGSGMILWLAGLKGVPTQLYEAASIDGASPMKQFANITLPQLSPIVFFNTVMGFIGALQAFDSIYVITRGQGAGPNDALLMPVYHLFINAFNYFKMGYASALAWVIFVIILVITAIQFVFARKWVYYEVER